MKILCLCSAGFVRSAATRIVLIGKHKDPDALGNNNTLEDHDVLIAGVDTNTQETIAYLCDWAEKILVAEPYIGGYLLPQYEHKIDRVFHIGQDIWKEPFHPGLHKKIKDEIKKITL